MNQEQINQDLATKETSASPLQRRLLAIFKSYMQSSATEMNKYWSRWDENQINYSGYRKLDEKDKANLEKGGTEKIYVPLSYAQVQTAAAGILGMLTQKARLFELMSFGPEDQSVVEGLERDIDYQVRHNRLYYFLYNFILDALVKGVAVGRCDWTVDKAKYRVKREVPAGGFMGSLLANIGLGTQQMTTIEVVEELTQYEGNKVTYISPYTFFPDPSVKLSDFQKGAFCATEQSEPLINVKQKEGSLYHGTKFIRNELANADLWSARPRYAGTFSKPTETSNLATNILGGKYSTGKVVDIVELFVKLIPRELKQYAPEIDVGDENEPIMFIVTVANDSKIIRFERYNELHGMFPFFCSQYSPDGDSYVGRSIPDLLQGLQYLISWLVNSRMMNIRQAIKNRFLVDPSKIEVKDIEAGSNIIRTKGPGGITSGITPINPADVTTQHIPFIGTLQQIAQIVTGINENAMGQYTSGRRSAAQTRGIGQAVQARLGMAANLIWYGGLDQLGCLLLSNTRQFRTRETYEQILGNDAMKYPFEEVILSDPQRIAGGFDFMPLDGLTDSEKQQTIGLMKELLGNAELIGAANLDVSKLLEYCFNISGVKNFEYFKAQEQAPQQPVEVVPDQAIQQGVANGTMIPTQGGDPVQALLQGLQ